MTHTGVIVAEGHDKFAPLDLFKKIRENNNRAFGVALWVPGETSIQTFPGSLEVPEAQLWFDMRKQFLTSIAYTWWGNCGKDKTFQAEDLQPFVLLRGADDKPAVVMMAEGNWIAKFDQPKSPFSAEHYLHEWMLKKVASIARQCSGDLSRIMDTLREDVHVEDISDKIGDRGVVAILAACERGTSWIQKNDKGLKADWGTCSNVYGLSSPAQVGVGENSMAAKLAASLTGGRTQTTVHADGQGATTTAVPQPSKVGNAGSLMDRLASGSSATTSPAPAPSNGGTDQTSADDGRMKDPVLDLEQPDAGGNIYWPRKFWKGRTIGKDIRRNYEGWLKSRNNGEVPDGWLENLIAAAKGDKPIMGIKGGQGEWRHPQSTAKGVKRGFDALAGINQKPPTTASGGHIVEPTREEIAFIAQKALEANSGSPDTMKLRAEWLQRPTVTEALNFDFTEGPSPALLLKLDAPKPNPLVEWFKAPAGEWDKFRPTEDDLAVLAEVNPRDMAKLFTQLRYDYIALQLKLLGVSTTTTVQPETLAQKLGLKPFSA